MGVYKFFLEDSRSLSAGPEKGYVNLLLGLRALALLRSTSTLFFTAYLLTNSSENSSQVNHRAVACDNSIKASDVGFRNINSDKLRPCDGTHFGFTSEGPQDCG